jgi:hypothetical protein
MRRHRDKAMGYGDLVHGLSLIHGWDEDRSGKARRMLKNGLGGDLTICDERTCPTFTA